MIDDQQRARELRKQAAEILAAAYKDAHFFGAMDDALSETPSPHCQVTITAITAALRAAPDAVALRVAMDTLEQIASAPDDQGARFKAAGAVAFLITQEAGLRGAPEVTDAMVEAAHSTYWAHPDDSGEDRPCIRAALEAALAARPQGVKG